MNTLHDLKKMLCKELEEYGKRDKLTAGTLDVVDKLTHTIKNLDKIIDKYADEEYSKAYGSYAMADRAYDGMSNADMSYARGRGAGARRDSMGRYASEGYSSHDITNELHNLYEAATDAHTKAMIRQIIDKM